MPTRAAPRIKHEEFMLTQIKAFSGGRFHTSPQFANAPGAFPKRHGTGDSVSSVSLSVGVGGALLSAPFFFAQNLAKK